MNEKTTIRFVLTGVKYSQSDLGKHYKTFCGLYEVYWFTSWFTSKPSNRSIYKEKSSYLFR